MTVAKPYYENEELSDSQSFFQDDEQDEADFQYINEADSWSIFQDDESMIQDEADFQYINDADSRSLSQEDESMMQDEADFQYIYDADSRSLSQEDESMMQDEADFQYINDADSRFFSQNDKSMIQDEAYFQYVNEPEENTNLEFADEMSDCEAHHGEIQTNYRNKYKKPLNYHCDKGYALDHIESVYSKWKKDRKWAFGCQKVSTLNPLPFI